MYIYSSGSFHNDVNDEDLPNLKDEVKASCGAHIRRIDRFIQLALIGSHRCVKGFALAQNTGMYVASSQGAKGNISRSLVQIYKEKEPLMPLNFINMVGNAASFYIAKALNIHGANLFLTRNHFTFEEALELALLDIGTGTAHAALVGTVDECITPLSHHRAQLRVAADTALGEGSHWWLIGDKQAGFDKAPLAEIVSLKHFTALAALDNYLQTLAREYAGMPLHIAAGIGLGETEKAFFPAQEYCQAINDYTKNLGFYESLGGFAFANIVHDEEHFPQDTLFIHIDKNRQGCFCCVALKRP